MTALALTLPFPAYDGPFDVLLQMVRREAYPMDALPVAEITARFLAYVQTSPVDQELAGEFLDTASWLVLLKSRSLLPQEGKEPEGPEPHDELRQALLDHEALRGAVDFLKKRAQYGHSSISSQEIGVSVPDENEASGMTLAEIVESARLALEALHSANSISILDPATIENHTAAIHRYLNKAHGRAVDTRPWFADQPSDDDRATLLLALLEEVRRGAILVHQSRPLEPILVKKAHNSGVSSENGANRHA